MFWGRGWREDVGRLKLLVFRDQEKIITNKQVGHMLRTKLSHVDEGGVSAGLGALDSVYLVDEGSCCPNKVK